jgi:hypothetical protein
MDSLVNTFMLTLEALKPEACVALAASDPGDPHSSREDAP